MELKRTLSLLDSVSILFGAIVGTGVFFTTGFILSDLNNPYLVMLAWILGGVFAMAGALSYSMSTVLFPQAGGDYIYLKHAYSPLVAFLSGWASLTMNFSATIATLVLAFYKYLEFVFPSINTTWTLFNIEIFTIHLSFGLPQIIGIGIILFFSSINYLGIKQSARLQNVLNLMKIVGILLFIIVGLFWGNKNIDLLSQYSLFPDLTNKWSFLFMSIIPVTFSYLGWNTITYIAGEVKDPTKNIPLSIILSTLLVILLYMSLNFLFLVSAPYDQIKSEEGIGVISAVYLFGQNIKLPISLFIMIAILSSTSAVIMGCSRIYYAMAKDELFFQSLSEIHPKYFSPYKSIFFQAVLASLFTMLGEVKFLLYSSTCSILFMSVLTAITPIILQKKGFHFQFKVFGYPYTPFLYSVMSLFVIGVLAKSQPVQALTGLGITALGIPIYYVFKMKQKSDSRK